MIAFTVLGKPTTQGSYRPMVSKSTHRAIMVPMMSAAVKAWRTAMGDAAHAAMSGRPPLRGPLWVSVRFVLARPKKPANEWPRGDCDKLQRALGDALTGIVYEDDGQICTWVACKVYGSPTGAQVEVMEHAAPVGTLEDRVHREMGIYRPAKSARVSTGGCSTVAPFAYCLACGGAGKYQITKGSESFWRHCECLR